MIEVKELGVPDAVAHLGELAQVLADCVAGGASVSFMAPFSTRAAEEFFEKILAEVEAGTRILLAAFLGSKLVGTVQIVTAMPPNQPHRAEIAKLLVSPGARGQGVGGRLMGYAEECARLKGKTLLVLDTVAGESGERLYSRLGWTRAGVIPRYALLPYGGWCDTVIFWKELRALADGDDRG